jgi:class 3 adenylate cyclase
MTAAGRGRRRSLLACLLVWLLALGLARLPLVERAELAWLDASFGLLRAMPARQAAPGPELALVVFDEASLHASGKPFALLHAELAAVLDALRLAGARAVALDLVLPAEDYAGLQPGAARRLALSLGQLRASAPLVLGQVPGGPDTPTARLYAAMAGSGGQASLLVTADADGVLRRLGPDVEGSLAGRVAQRLGVPARAGIVDFSLGAPFAYTPAAQVGALLAAADLATLRRRFGGKVVLVGAVLPDQDRQRLPVSLAAWERGMAQPGLVFQAQAVRSLLQGRTIAAPPGLGAAAALALLVPVWLLRRRLAAALAAGLLALAGAFAAAVVLLAQGLHLPLAAAVLAVGGALAWLAGAALHEHRAERARLRAIFAGYVSPAILDTILSGALRNGPRRSHVAFLFADVRGFTQLCATRSPEAVIAFLNRYYEAITVPLHRHGGTIDKFSGDGIMAFFGAPQPSANPERDAIQAALGMLDALDTLNAALQAEGQAPVRIGIGIAAGEAVLGNVGSAARHDYTATGAPAALAAHIQQHCKGTPYALLVERAAFEAAGHCAAAFESLEADLDKHGRVRLAGLCAQA